MSILLRFRHLDTTVRLSASRRNSATGGSSPSPENENGFPMNRSPKRSPVLGRKRGVSPNPSTTNNGTNK